MMKFRFNLKDVDVIAPGIDGIETFYLGYETFNQNNTVVKSKLIAMMTARRLTIGTRLACEVAIRLLNKHKDIACVVFSSRHGELIRNYSILTAIATDKDVSPTEFATSVHNSAVGHFTILTKRPIISSSVSSGYDSFIQSIIESLSILEDAQKALLVDFDGAIPDFYSEKIGNIAAFPFASGFLIEKGEDICISSSNEEVKEEFCFNSESKNYIMPQSFIFLHNIKYKKSFMLDGNRYRWKVEHA